MAKAKTKDTPGEPGTGPVQGIHKRSDFTPRTRKVLAASTGKDGYQYNGTEARAVKLLSMAGLVQVTSNTPPICKATDAGQAVAQQFADEAKRGKK